MDSVKVVADDSADVVSTTEYMPYGETWITQGSEDSKPKFNGQEYDKESGLYYYNARHYAPDIARFASADTAIDGALSTQGWNRYAYCGNNPVMYKDPTGHFSFSAGVGAVVGYSSSDGWNVGIGISGQVGSTGGNASYVWNQNNSQTATISGNGKIGIGYVSINIGLGYSYNTVSGHSVNGCIGGSYIVGIELGGSMYWNKNGQYMGSSVYAKGYVGDCNNNVARGYEYGTGTCKSGWFTSVSVGGFTAKKFDDGNWTYGYSYTQTLYEVEYDSEAIGPEGRQAATEEKPFSTKAGGRELNPDNYVLINPMTRQELRMLYMGIVIERLGDDNFTFEVSGGDRYIGEDGNVYSATYNTIEDSPGSAGSDSPHTIEKGARGVDIKIIGVSNEVIKNAIKNYTSIKSCDVKYNNDYPRNPHVHINTPNTPYYRIKLE